MAAATATPTLGTMSKSGTTGGSQDPLGGPVSDPVAGVPISTVLLMVWTSPAGHPKPERWALQGCIRAGLPGAEALERRPPVDAPRPRPADSLGQRRVDAQAQRAVVRATLGSSSADGARSTATNPASPTHVRPEPAPGATTRPPIDGGRPAAGGRGRRTRRREGQEAPYAAPRRGSRVGSRRKPWRTTPKRTAAGRPDDRDPPGMTHRPSARTASSSLEGESRRGRCPGRRPGGGASQRGLCAAPGKGSRTST